MRGQVQNFFRKSYWFWVVSKMLLIIMLAISAIGLLKEGGLKNTELAVNLFGLALAILLCITVAQDFSFSSSAKLLKIITGVLLIFSGCALGVVLLNISESSKSSLFVLGYPFVMWMLLIGLFELLNIRRYLPDE